MVLIMDDNFFFINFNYFEFLELEYDGLFMLIFVEVDMDLFDDKKLIISKVVVVEVFLLLDIDNVI